MQSLLLQRGRCATSASATSTATLTAGASHPPAKLASSGVSSAVAWIKKPARVAVVSCRPTVCGGGRTGAGGQQGVFTFQHVPWKAVAAPEHRRCVGPHVPPTTPGRTWMPVAMNSHRPSSEAAIAV